jgi:hypothetical protein
VNRFGSDTAAFAVVTGGLGNHQPDLDRIAQPNQAITELGGTVKHFDFVL